MAEPASSEDTLALVDALREEGVHHWDPVRFHYVEALARRASAHQGPVRRILDAKLAEAVAALRVRVEQMPSAAPIPLATGALRDSLGDLVRHMAQHSAERSDGHLEAHITPRAELKSVRYFRNTWSRLSAEKQVSHALDQAPKNAGPINSHMVALRSLALMRDTSPDYLNRFMSYMDTLLCLDTGGKKSTPAAKAPRAVKTKS